MHSTTLAVLLGGLGLASAAPGRYASTDVSALLSKRWYYDVCANDCSLSGVAMPDVNTLQLSLENNFSDQCPPIAIKAADGSTIISEVCLDFQGTNLWFNFSSFAGYTTTSATVTWKLKGNVDDSGSWTDPPPTTALTCSQATGDSQFKCQLPFSTIINEPSTSSILTLMAGMCPNGAREALDFYLEFSGQAKSVDASTGAVTTVTFDNLPPCQTRDSNNQCTEYATSPEYFEISYRCSSCETAPCASSSSSITTVSSTTSTTSTTKTTTSPPTTLISTTSCTTTTSTKTTSTKTTTTPPAPTKTCTYGTAFGWNEKSLALNSCSGGSSCNRWGWYETPTLSQLQSSMTGPLYVAPGSTNDLTRVVKVGTWTATADSKGSVTVSYTISGTSSTSTTYGLSEVRVQLGCLPLSQCSPSYYTYRSGSLASVGSFKTAPIAWPSCGTSSGSGGLLGSIIGGVLGSIFGSGGSSSSSSSQVSLIVYAVVNVLSTTPGTCPAPVCY